MILISHFKKGVNMEVIIFWGLPILVKLCSHSLNYYDQMTEFHLAVNVDAFRGIHIYISVCVCVCIVIYF